MLEKFANKFKTYIYVSSDELGKWHKISENSVGETYLLIQ